MVSLSLLSFALHSWTPANNISTWKCNASSPPENQLSSKKQHDGFVCFPDDFRCNSVFLQFFRYQIKKPNPRMHTTLSTSDVSYVEFCIRIKYYPPSMTAIIFFIKAAVTAHKRTSRCSLLMFPRRRSNTGAATLSSKISTPPFLSSLTALFNLFEAISGVIKWQTIQRAVVLNLRVETLYPVSSSCHSVPKL